MSLTDIAVDMQHLLLAHARRVQDTPLAVSRSPLVQALPRLLERAVPCYWSWPTVTAAEAVARTYPKTAHVLPADLIAPVQWRYLDNPALTAIPDPVFEIVEAILLADGALLHAPNTYTVTLFCRVKPSEREAPFRIPLPAWTAYIPLGEPWHPRLRFDQLLSMNHLDMNTAELEQAVHLVQFTLSSVCWLRSTVASPDRVATSRATRRRLALDMDHQTTVITLRRRDPAAPSADSPSTPVEWSCRWAVKAHWRNQAVKDGHRPTLIAPYVKGPAGQPFRSREVRYKVTR